MINEMGDVSKVICISKTKWDMKILLAPSLISQKVAYCRKNKGDTPQIVENGIPCRYMLVI